MARSKPGWKPWGDHPVVVTLAAIASIITIIVTIIGLLPGNTPKVESKHGVVAGRDIRDSTIMLNNPDQEKAISEIQDKIRPSMIFDQKGTYFDNNDALDYIEDIKVNTKNISGYDIIQSIVVHSKMYLEMTPLLEPQTNAGYSIISEKRGEKFEIIYNLKEVGIYRTELNPKFRLEIRNPPLINGRK